MLGGIAGQGGLNIDSKTPSIYTSVSNSTSNVSLVNISGSGYLTSLSLSNKGETSAATGYFTLVVDGVTKVNDAGFQNSIVLAPTVEFATSVQIYYRTSASTRYIGAVANILLN